VVELGKVHVLPAPQVAVGAAALASAAALPFTFTSLLDKWLTPDVNWLMSPVNCQPAPLPEESLTMDVAAAPSERSLPLSVADQLTALGPVNARVPPVSVAVPVAAETLAIVAKVKAKPATAASVSHRPFPWLDM
jgi:hypothetical protein